MGDQSTFPSSAPSEDTFPSTHYSDVERRLLLRLSRLTLFGAVGRNRPPDVNLGAFGSKLTELKGCFVTLRKAGNLRGCMGHIFPKVPLWRAVMENTESAAMRDPRFPAVVRDELVKIGIEINVLTPPEHLPFSSSDDLLSKLRPRMQGVVLQIAGRVATFLPQVWSQFSDEERFLEALAQKAGSKGADWRRPGVSVMTYRVEAFQEDDPA